VTGNIKTWLHQTQLTLPHAILTTLLYYHQLMTK